MSEEKIEGKESYKVVCPECRRILELGSIVSGSEMSYKREVKCSCGVTIVVPCIRAQLAAESLKEPA